MNTAAIKIGLEEYLRLNNWAEQKGANPPCWKSSDNNFIIQILSDGIDVHKVVGNKNTYLAWSKVTNGKIEETIKNYSV